jgi:hypothetical protein
MLRARASFSGAEHALLEFALQDAANKNHHHGSPTPAAEALFVSLREDPRPLTAGSAPDFATMRDAGCTHFQLGGRDVYEVCVVRNGQWFHLYATRRAAAGAPSPHTTFTERGSVAVASWSTGDTLYALASPAGREALDTLI